MQNKYANILLLKRHTFFNMYIVQPLITNHRKHIKQHMILII